MELPTKPIPVELSDGTVVRIEATLIGEQRVAFQSRSFKEITTVVKAIAKELAGTLQEVRQEASPDKVSVKLGLEVAVESGQLTALIVKGAGKANLEITMEWNSN
jgi:Trypsin-co-occurring domain 1